MGLAEEGRHEREEEQHDQPRRDDDEAGGEGDDGDEVLPLVEHLPDEAEAARRLPPGALELVVEVGVLEVLQVQLGGVLHQPHRRLVREEVAEEAVEEGGGAAQDVREDGEAELDGDERPERAEVARRVGEADVGEPHDLVNDELADPQHRHGQAGPDEPERDAPRQHPRARLPHEPEQRREVPQRLEPLLPVHLLAAWTSARTSGCPTGWTSVLLRGGAGGRGRAAGEAPREVGEEGHGRGAGAAPGFLPTLPSNSPLRPGAGRSRRASAPRSVAPGSGGAGG